MRRFVTSGVGLPATVAPISHAVVVDDICYLSGQLSVDAHGTYVPGTTREEAVRAFDHLFAAVRAAGFEVQDLVFIDLCFIDLSEVDAINALYAELFPPQRRPARTIQQSAALPYGGRIKVAGVAVRERC